jgi:predicted DNA-binding antitoxin AbrB/MazE fold protein
MSLTVEAVYENCVLKLDGPLPLKAHERVQITVHAPIHCLADSYGMMGFKGAAEQADYFAADPELDYPPPADEP